MTTTYVIVESGSGRVAGTQTMPDAFAPVLGNGIVPLSAFPVAAGRLASGSISGTGAAASAALLGALVYSVSGPFSGSVRLERSFDGGDTYVPCVDDDGVSVALTVPGEIRVTESESSVLYRLNCTAYASGPIAWQVGR